ncbi:MAG: adenylate/guanylate cyclase domain-containing protein [Burkholderiales bacterium]|nr:adenylate/guanylate cyclase domain-containing protein [Burkholderiales bacterium]
MRLVDWLPAALCALAAVAAAAWWMRRREGRLWRLLAEGNRKLEDLQRQFERFVPADIVDRLSGDAAAWAPERRRVTMLFADLRGFTALCDRLDPAVAVDILNGYFAHMDAAIARHHGHVNELVGDGLLALFGAFEANAWQERDAVLAALDMRAALARYNESLAKRSLPALKFGVGIHCGEVVAGVLGAGVLSKFGVTGDPINVASRIEGLTRDFAVDLLVSEDVRIRLDARFRVREMPPAAVKGKARPIVTFHVEGVADAAPVA